MSNDLLPSVHICKCLGEKKENEEMDVKRRERAIHQLSNKKNGQSDTERVCMCEIECRKGRKPKEDRGT